MKLFRLSIIVFLNFALLIFPFISTAQNENTDLRYMHQEVQDDPYMAMPVDQYRTSPAYRYRSSIIFTTQVNVNENGENILGDAANEPSIAVDPNDPERIVIGWRQFDNVASNFRQAGNAYSDDRGESWTVPEPIEPGVFRSDPVLDVNSDGKFYYNSLTKNLNGDYWCDIFQSDNSGFNWDSGTYALGGDKQWMHIDKNGGIGDGNIYEFWNVDFSICSPGLYTRSTDGGLTYEECDGMPGDPFWGTLTTGPDGEMYTVGAQSNTNIIITKSTTAQDPDVLTSWDFSIYIDLDGRLGGFRPINQGGLLGQAWIDADRSDGPDGGNVYVLASVDRDDIDVADVMFARSTNGGHTWDPPVRINDDNPEEENVWQWFGTMSVAPNGRIDAAWLDTRNAPGTNEFMSELYYSFSSDGGVTWSDNERLSEQFNPKVGYPNQNKMGDYFDMVSHNNGAHLAWCNTINGEQDVYYSFITPWVVSVNESLTNNNQLSLISYPNPVRDKTTLRYTLPEKTSVEITLVDIFGSTIEVIANENQSHGIHNIVYNTDKLVNGIYFINLNTGSKSETIKITVID
jgi:type IX secretion system substrate protein